MQYNSRKTKKLYEQFKSLENPANSSAKMYFSPEKIIKLFNNHPELRLLDDISYLNIAQMAAADLDDADPQEMLGFIVDHKMIEYLVSGDEFFGNYPPPNSVCCPPDFIPIGKMPTNEFTGFTREQTRRNILFVGPNGSGKTTCLKIPLKDPELIQKSCVVVFAKKRELRGLIELSSTLGTVLVFRIGEFPLVFFQGPDVVNDIIWANEITKTFGHCYERMSAHRYMNIKLCEMLSNRPVGCYPTLKQLIESLEKTRPRFNSREAIYRESIFYCLSDLSLCLGDCTEYSYSNFMELIFSSPGLKVIEVDTLPQEHLSFVANYFMKWIYLKKLYLS